MKDVLFAKVKLESTMAQTQPQPEIYTPSLVKSMLHNKVCIHIAIVDVYSIVIGYWLVKFDQTE